MSDLLWKPDEDTYANSAIKNFADFKKRYTKYNGNFLFYSMSVRDYETLALNMAEIKRYIEQQKQIIIYYEQAVAPKPKNEKVEKK